MTSQASDPRDSALVRAARGLPTTHTPVWFMRQAGRSLPEYKAARADVPMLQACRTPDLVCEITMQPVRRHGVDAAVFFSDIVVPLAAAGVDVDIKPGVGPVIAHPVRTAADVEALPELDAAPDRGHRTVRPAAARRTRWHSADRFRRGAVHSRQLPRRGWPSKNHEHTKALMYGAPDVWNALCAKLSRISGTVPAGAGRGRRERHTTLRLMGRCVVAGRLQALRAAALDCGT